MKHTDLVIILDRSGSMEPIKKDVEGGFRDFVKKQRKEPGSCGLTLVQFDSQSVETVYSGTPIKDVPELVFEPRGGTPLLYAVGSTIDNLDKAFAALPADRRPDQVMVVIITDGQENDARGYTRDQIKRLIEEHQGQGWAFIYLGANVDAFAEAGSMGIPVASASPYDHNSGGVRAMMIAASDQAVSYRSKGLGAVGFTAAQRSSMSAQPVPTVTTAGTNVAPPTEDPGYKLGKQ